jgi:hypothetical protein
MHPVTYLMSTQGSSGAGIVAKAWCFSGRFFNEVLTLEVVSHSYLH